jgi:hypothetical protein
LTSTGPVGSFATSTSSTRTTPELTFVKILIVATSPFSVRSSFSAVSLLSTGTFEPPNARYAANARWLVT